MNTYYYALDLDGDWLFDNFPEEAVFLINDYKNTERVVKLQIKNEKLNCRIGKKSSQYGTVFTLTWDEKYVRSYKLFKELVNLSSVSLKSFINFKKDVERKQIERTIEFSHNVTSLNSYTIQELFALIPQDKLIGNINKQLDFVKNMIINKTETAATSLLGLIKYALAMKVEFSVYERTLQPYGNVKRIEQPIRPIVLSVLQIFIQDFEKKGIEVSLDASDKSDKLLYVEYDSLFVSLFYVLENSLKYCCPKTKFKIIFAEESSQFSILFKMVSLKIEDNEVEKLAIRGWRSEAAKSLNQKGQGIGMYRIQKTLKLNDAEIEVIPRYFDYPKKIGNTSYEGNLFKIKFKGQQSWMSTQVDLA